MRLKKNLLLFFLLSTCILLFTACASGVYNNSMNTIAMYTQSNAELGTNYLLGKGVKQDDAKAFYYFHKAALEDDAFAQNEVAYMYVAGKGTQRDYQKALKYYKKAAEHGLASAQYSLGLLYAKGLGTVSDPKIAREWFNKSAAHGFEPAQLALKHNVS